MTSSQLAGALLGLGRAQLTAAIDRLPAWVRSELAALFRSTAAVVDNPPNAEERNALRALMREKRQLAPFGPDGVPSLIVRDGIPFDPRRPRGGI